jgi:ribosome-associated protein
MIHITEGIVLNEKDIRERFVRVERAGGRHVPRHATAVELSIDLGKLVLPDDVAMRLMALAAARINSDGRLVLVARADRSQLKNREAARKQLMKLLVRAAAVPRDRRATRPRTAVRKARKEEKQIRGAIKQARRGVLAGL